MVSPRKTFQPRATALPNTTLLCGGTTEKASSDTAGQSFSPAIIRGQNSCVAAVSTVTTATRQFTATASAAPDGLHGRGTDLLDVAEQGGPGEAAGIAHEC